MRHFATLDAMRGIAAIAVMMWHSTTQPVPVPGGYLAVDLFFAISGFVMALTYEERLRQGMTARHFLTLRAARLWPMLALGSLLSIVLMNGWIGMAFLIPDFRGPTALFPSNPPYWSLLMEVAAYTAFAFGGARLSTRQVAGVALAAGLALCVAAAGDRPFHEFGSFWATIPQGLARVAFSFSIGMLIYRLRAACALPKATGRSAWLLPLLTLPIALLVPIPGQLEPLLVVLLVLPGALWLGTKWEVPHARLAAALGAMSYPLYCIHMPGLWIGRQFDAPEPIVWCALIALSLALDRWFDRPMRQVLKAVADGSPKALKPA